MNNYIRGKKASYMELHHFNNPHNSWRFLGLDDASETETSVTPNVSAQQESATEAYDLVREELEEFGDDVLKDVKKAAKSHREKDGKNVPVTVKRGDTEIFVFVDYENKKPISFKFKNTEDSPSVLFRGHDDKIFVTADGGTYKVKRKQKLNGDTRKAKVVGVNNQKLHKKTGYKYKFDGKGELKNGDESTFAARQVEQQAFQKKSEAAAAATSASNVELRSLRATLEALNKPTPAPAPNPYQYGYVNPRLNLTNVGQSHALAAMNEYARSCSANGPRALTTAFPNYGRQYMPPNSSYQYQYASPSVLPNQPQSYMEQVDTVDRVFNAPPSRLDNVGNAQRWMDTIFDVLAYELGNGKVNRNNLLEAIINKFLALPENAANEARYRNFLTSSASSDFKQNFLLKTAERMARTIAMGKLNPAQQAMAREQDLENNRQWNAPREAIIRIYEKSCSLSDTTTGKGAVTNVIENFDLPSVVDKELTNTSSSTASSTTSTTSATTIDATTTQPETTGTATHDTEIKTYDIGANTVEQQKWNTIMNRDVLKNEHLKKEAETLSEIATKAAGDGQKFETIFKESLQASYRKLPIDKQAEIKNEVLKNIYKPGMNKIYTDIIQPVNTTPLAQYTTAQKDRVAFNEVSLTEILTNPAASYAKLNKQYSKEIATTNPITNQEKVIVSDAVGLNTVEKNAVDGLKNIVTKYNKATADDVVQIDRIINEAQTRGVGIDKVVKEKIEDGVTFSTEFQKQVQGDEVGFSTIVAKNADDIVGINVVTKYTEDLTPMTEVIVRDIKIDEVGFVTVNIETAEETIEVINVQKEEIVEIQESYEESHEITTDDITEYGGIEEDEYHDDHGELEEDEYHDDPGTIEEEDDFDDEEDIEEDDPVDPDVPEIVEIDPVTGESLINITELVGGDGVRYEWGYQHIEAGQPTTHTQTQIGRVNINVTSTQVPTTIEGTKGIIKGKHAVEAWCKDCEGGNNATGTLSGLANKLIRAEGLSGVNMNNITVRYYNHPNYRSQLASSKQYLDKLQGKDYTICAKSCGRRPGKNYALENRVPTIEDVTCGEIQYIEQTGVDGMDLLMRDLKQYVYLEKQPNGQYMLVVSGHDYTGCGTESQTTYETEYTVHQRHTHGGWSGSSDSSEPARQKTVKRDQLLTEVKKSTNWPGLQKKYATQIQTISGTSAKQNKVADLIYAELNITAYGAQTHNWVSPSTTKEKHTYTIRKNGDVSITRSGDTKQAAWDQIKNESVLTAIENTWNEVTPNDLFEEADVKDKANGFVEKQTTETTLISATTATSLNEIADNIKAKIDEIPVSEPDLRIAINYGGSFDGTNFGGNSIAERQAKQQAIFDYLTGETVNERTIPADKKISASSFIQEVPPFGGTQKPGLADKQLQVSYSNAETSQTSSITEPTGSSSTSTQDQIETSDAITVPNYLSDNAAIFRDVALIDSLTPPNNLKLTIGGRRISIRDALKTANSVVTNPTKGNVLGVKKYEEFYKVLTAQPGATYVQHFLKKLKINAEADPNLLKHLGNTSGFMQTVENSSGPLPISFLKSIATRQENLEPKFREADFWSDITDPYESTSTYVGSAISWISNAVGNVVNAVTDFEVWDGMALFNSDTQQVIVSEENEAKTFYTFDAMQSDLNSNATFGAV